MTDLIRLEHLGIHLKSRQGLKTLVHDVTFSINAGESLGLVGESGSGKSLTARAIMGLHPTSAQLTGICQFKNKDISGMSGRELREYRTRDVAMIFQDPHAHINPVRKIGDFLTEALVSNLKMPKAEAVSRVSRTLEEVGLSDPHRRLNQYPHELSGGMLQRVMIAAALAADPALLVADEPTTALDVTTQAEVMALLDKLRRERNMAMLFITHDLDLAAAVCDRTAVMYAGKIVEMQASDMLHWHPRHPYTAALAKSRPAIDARLARLLVIPGSPPSGGAATGGCPFAPRCAYATNLCQEQEPALRHLGGGLAACHHSERIESQLRVEGEGSVCV